MHKWIMDKFGVKGVQWVLRGLSAIMLGTAGWAWWRTGKIDGFVEAADIVEKSLNEK